MQSPMLRSLRIEWAKVHERETYPFNLPVIRTLDEMCFRSAVTFLVGENGSGKSTLLEALALATGFGPQGGGPQSVNAMRDSGDQGPQTLADVVRLTWSSRIRSRYFYRAESFFNVASHVDSLVEFEPDKALVPYGGKSLHERSHGETFMELLERRLLGGGLYLFDEPEAALSPQRQLSFLLWLRRHIREHPESQFVVATHSPILMAFPGAEVLGFDGARIAPVEFRQTDNFQVLRGFLNDPDRYLDALFRDEP